jgi:Zn-dependent M16 (insulinase) family peptidase
MTELDILGALLTDGSVSPMYKALIQPGIGTSSFLLPFNCSTFASSFAIGLDGVSAENTKRFEAVVLQALQNVVAKGFDPEHIDAVLRNKELKALKKSDQQGMNILFQVAVFWVNGVNPALAVDSRAELARVRLKWQTDPRMFESHVEKYLLDNQHRLFYIGTPRKNFINNWNSEIADGLAALKSRLTDEERNAINERALAVRALNDEEKPVHLLPKITKNDLNVAGKFYAPDYESESICVFRQPLAGLTHVRVAVDLPIDVANIELVDLLGRLLHKLGAGDLDEEQFGLYIEKYIAGFQPYTDAILDFDDPDKFVYSLVLLGYCRDADVEHLLAAFAMCLRDPHVGDLRVLETVVRGQYRDWTQSLSDHASDYVKQRLKATKRPFNMLDELASGLTCLARLGAMIEAGDWAGLSRDLGFVVANIIRKGRVRVCVHLSSAEQQERILPSLTKFIGEFHNEFCPNVPELLMQQMQQLAGHKKVFLQADTKSNHCGWARAARSYCHPMSVILDGMADLIQNEYLHESIRVALGAYGVFCAYDAEEGVFTMMSYQDSNVTGVVAAFREAVKAAVQGRGIDDEVVENTVLRCFSRLDTPVAPQSRGLLYWRGTTAEIMQRRRRILYNMTKEQLMQAAAMLQELDGNFVVFSSEVMSKAPDGFEVLPLVQVLS